MNRSIEKKTSDPCSGRHGDTADVQGGSKRMNEHSLHVLMLR